MLGYHFYGKVENSIENDKFHARNLFRKKGDTAGDFIPPGIPSRGSLPCEEFNAGESAQKFYDFIPDDCRFLAVLLSWTEY